MTKIVYKDIAPGAAEETTVAMSDLQPFTPISELMTGGTAQKISTLEDGYSLMDDTFLLFPDDPSEVWWGAWSKSMSGEDGTFETPIVLTLTMPQLHTSVGLTFEFDPFEPNWCTDLNVKWYNGNTLLADQDFAPDAASYACIYEVRNYNKVVVTFRAMSKSYRYLKLKTPLYGIERVFGMDELRSVNLLQGCSPISEELEINTMDCTISSRDPVPFIFQRKQPMEVYHDDTLQAVTYITGATRSGVSLYDVETGDKVGLADESTHTGGVYSGITFAALVDEILGGAFAYEIDAALREVTLSGWLPIATKRENLAQAAFATGAIVDTSMSDRIRIFSPPAEISSTFGKDRIFSGGTIDTTALVTAVEVTEHSYKQGTEESELYNDVLDGAARVTFGEPMHGLTITGGTITAHGANWADITGTGGTVVLSGKAYLHQTRIITLRNPDVSAVDAENVVQVTDATLVTSSNSAAVAQRVYDRYQMRETVSCDVVLHDEKPGDRVSVETEFAGVKTGTIVSIDASLARKRIGRMVVLCD